MRPALENITLLFKAFSDPIRLRLVVLLSLHGETCVCHLAQAVGEPAFKVSRHLGVLRSLGFVEAKREGTWIHYRLAEPRDAVENALMEFIRGPLATQESTMRDLSRLKEGPCPKE